VRTLKFSPAYSPVEWFECSAIANFPRALILAGGWPRKALGADGVLDVCDRFCVAASITCLLVDCMDMIMSQCALWFLRPLSHALI